MLDIGPDKIVVVLIFALVVLGPARLVETARALGRARARLRQFSSGLSPETARVIRDPRRALLDALAEPRRAMADVAEAANECVAPVGDEESKAGES